MITTSLYQQVIKTASNAIEPLYGKQMKVILLEYYNVKYGYDAYGHSAVKSGWFLLLSQTIQSWDVYGMKVENGKVVTLQKGQVKVSF